MSPNDLPHIPPHAPQSSTESSTGVYFLFLQGALVYVGRSRDCLNRVRSHRASGRQFDRHLIAPCDPGDAEWMERALIAAMEPTQNRALFAAPSSVGLAGEHPLSLLNVTAARKRVRAFYLQREFDAAVRSGDLVFRLKNPEATSRTAQRVIPLGDLIAWCEAQQRNRGFANKETVDE